MTLNHELFIKDPSTYAIPNDGVSKIARPDDDRQWEVLRYELTSFVCEGEYATGLQRILDSYLTNLPRATQPAVWISGFYGSGKSHLVRVLEHLWADTALPDGASARGLVGLTDPIRDGLTELTIAAKRMGAVPWSAAGALDTAGADQLNLAFLATVLRAAGLPDKVPPARLTLWLRELGIFEAVSGRLAAIGKDFADEARRYNLSVPLASAVLAERPDLADSPAALLQLFKNQYRDADALSTSDTIDLLREVLQGVGGGSVPPTLIVLDEVQQYINEDGDRALAVQHLVEAVSSQFAGRVLVVATGQQELMSDPQLQKIQDRFSVKVHLRNQDVDQVVRRVLLAKEPAHAPELTATLDAAKGEISRELAGARLQHRDADDAVLTPDYPLLPSRRRFWEEVLRVADQGGRAGQLRSQLRVVHEANRTVAQRPVGTVVGADFLYDQKNADMNASGTLLKEVQLLIAEQASHADDGALRARILSVIHLISLLPTDGPRDTGVRATPEHIADLLVEDLAADGHDLRQRVPDLLATLARDGVVQQHGHEFRMQTAEGREWDQDFRARRSGLSGDPGAVAAVRDRRLQDAVKAALPGQVSQGRNKVQRQLALQVGDTEPQILDRVPVWVRSQWDGLGHQQFADLARGAGSESPLVFVYLARIRSDELKDAVLDLTAAEQVLGTRPQPTTDEGRQAREAMVSQHSNAEARVRSIVGDVLAEAKVELAGGGVPDGSSFRERIENAARRAVERLYPEFGLADHPGWSAVVDRLKVGGGSDALTKVGYDGPVQDQVVVKAVLSQVGVSGVGGKDLLDRFTGAPYGWNHDAVRGAIGGLMAAGQVTALVNGALADVKAVLNLGPRLGPLHLRRESAVVSPMQQVRATSVLQRMGITATDGALTERVHRALAALTERATRVSGRPPLPEVNLPAALVEVAGLTGNAQVLALLSAEDEAVAFTELLSGLEGRLEGRLAALSTTRRLAVASGTQIADEERRRLAAFEAGRDLLAGIDAVTPILLDLTAAVRAAVLTASDRYERARVSVVTGLEETPAWTALQPEHRRLLLDDVDLASRDVQDLRDPPAVLAEVEKRPLAGWRDAVDALPARGARVLAAAVHATTPSAVDVGLPGRTITSEGELDAYLTAVREVLSVALRSHGTIMVRGS